MKKYGQKGLIIKPPRENYAHFEAFCVLEGMIR
jgi:hypothetical protein